jgi:predicted nucleotidyltransferase
MKTEYISPFCDEQGIDLLVLFGSRTSGEGRAGSDIDVAVKMRKGMKFSMLDLIAALTDFFEDGEIDLVVLTRDTDPLLLHEIFSMGKLLFEARPGLFENEKLRAWNLYLDIEKLRKRQKEYLREFVRRSGNVA